MKTDSIVDTLRKYNEARKPWYDHVQTTGYCYCGAELCEPIGKWQSEHMECSVTHAPDQQASEPMEPITHDGSMVSGCCGADFMEHRPGGGGRYFSCAKCDGPCGICSPSDPVSNDVKPEPIPIAKSAGVWEHGFEAARKRLTHVVENCIPLDARDREALAYLLEAGTPRDTEVKKT